MMRKLTLFFGIALLTLFLFLAGYSLFEGSQELRNVPAFTAPAVVDFVPGLQEEDLQSEKLVLVNFWASWCPPCLAEMPMLYELRDVMEVVGILFQDIPANAKAFLEQGIQPFDKIGDDKKGTVAISWGVINVPTSFLVQDGKIIATFPGPLSAENVAHIKSISKKGPPY